MLGCFLILPGFLRQTSIATSLASYKDGERKDGNHETPTWQAEDAQVLQEMPAPWLWKIFRSQYRLLSRNTELLLLHL